MNEGGGMGPENTQGLAPFSAKAELGATPAQRPLREIPLGSIVDAKGERGRILATKLGEAEISMVKEIMGLPEDVSPKVRVEMPMPADSVPLTGEENAVGAKLNSGQADRESAANDNGVSAEKSRKRLMRAGMSVSAAAIATMLVAGSPKPAEADVAGDLLKIGIGAVAGIVIKGGINPTERQAKNTIDHGTRDENLVIQGDANVGKTIMRGQKYEGDTMGAYAARQKELDFKYQLYAETKADLDAKVQAGVMSRKDADDILRNTGYDFKTYYKLSGDNKARLGGTLIAQDEQLGHMVRGDKTSTNIQRFQEKANYLKTGNVIVGQGARDTVGEVAGAARGGTRVLEKGIEDIFR